MGNGIISYNISALIVLLIGGVYFFRTSPKRTARFILYVFIMVIDAAAGLMDIARVLLARMDMAGGAVWMLANTVYMLGICLVPPIYMLYIIEATDTWHRAAKHKLWMAIITSPVIIGSVITVLGMKMPILISAVNAKEVHYAWGYYLVCAVVIFYAIVDIAMAIKMKKYMGRMYSVELIVPVVVVVGSILIKLIFPAQHVIVFAVAIDCLLLILINRRAEENLDITTGMHSYWMFAKDMKLKISTGKELGLILVNIVNFEHAIRIAGYDEVLEMMKPLSSEIMRVMSSYKARFTCYYNGDGKFAIELSQKLFENIAEIANTITKSINQNLKLEISDFNIKINTCVVNCPTDVSDVESLFMLISDLDLFHSDGRILSASEITGTKEFTMKKEMTLILDRAMANQYFSVFYQPIYNVEKRRFTSAEALIRLRDPKFGYISPGLFIPLAEKSGAIHDIGSFVINEVCKFIASDEFKNLGVDYIEINLSVMQCLRADLAEEIIAKAALYEIDPSKINLEITETASAYSQEKLRSNMFALSKAGFTFSLDDFGTGYSNLMRITSLPLSIVKLDRTFVLLEEGNGDFHNIILNLIKMLKEMGMHVLVEGIETKEMVETFTELGVDEIQGFYFSRPLTKTDYIRFLKEQNVGK